MKVYIGRDNVARAAASPALGNVAYKSNDVLVAADRLPVINLPLGDGRLLLIWGSVFALRQPDGSMLKINVLKEPIPALKQLAASMKVDAIVKNLEGHFTGVLVTSPTDAVIFGDAFNRKDIFYCLKGNDLAAATDLKSIVDIYPPKAYNQEALVNMFLVYGNYAPKKHTIYEGINRLGVGEYFSYKQGKVKIESFPFEPLSVEDYKEDKLNEYSELLHSAVDIRSSEEFNWLSLSSGWDSSSILALLVKLRGASKVRGVIARIKYSDENGVTNQFEVDRATKIAEYFKVPLDIVEVDFTKKEHLNFRLQTKDSLRANHLYALVNYNSMRIAEYISTQAKPGHSLFNGEISDGSHNIGFAQFASILEHPDLNFREYSDKMASYLFGPSYFASILRGDSSKDFIYNVFKTRAAGSAFDDPAKMDVKERKVRFAESFFFSPLRVPFFNHLTNSPSLTPNGRQAHQKVMRENYLNDFVDQVKPETLYSWMLRLYNSFHWQGSTVKGMWNSLNFYNHQISMPFWDSRIQRFLSAMPETWGRGLDLNPTKYPLKWMLKNKMDYPHHLQTGPHSYLYDVNPNWSADADILYSKFDRPYFKELIKDYQFEQVLKDTHFNLPYLRKLTDDYVNDKVVSGQERTDLKNLISLCAVGWY